MTINSKGIIGYEKGGMNSKEWYNLLKNLLMINLKIMEDLIK